MLKKKSALAHKSWLNMFVLWLVSTKWEQRLELVKRLHPSWPLDPWSPGPHQTSDLEVRGLTSPALAQRSNGPPLSLPAPVWQLYESSSHWANKGQAKGDHLCASDLYTTLISVMLEKHRNTEVIVTDLNTGELCVYRQWKHVEACNQQNNKTRATVVVTRMAMQRENCVCLC